MPAWLPACLPAIRPTSSRSIDLVFSHNTEYWLANTDLLFRLRFIHCSMVSPFILHCFPFPLTGERKRWEIAEEVSMNYTAYTYYITLMATFMCTWLCHLLKIINKCIVAVYWFKSARMVSCWDLHACSWIVICQYSYC